MTQWSLKLIKYFCNEITKLQVRYLDGYRRVANLLDDALIAECHESLIEIKFVNTDSFTMQNIDKPFENVRKATSVRNKCHYLIGNFSKWFPNAHTLYLVQQNSIQLEDRKMLEQHFPVLKHFKIGNIPEENGSLKLKEYIVKN